MYEYLSDLFSTFKELDEFRLAEQLLKMRLQTKPLLKQIFRQ